MPQKQIHISVEKEFHEAFVTALKQLRYKTQSEFFREKMRETISHAEKMNKKGTSAGEKRESFREVLADQIQQIGDKAERMSRR